MRLAPLRLLKEAVAAASRSSCEAGTHNLIKKEAGRLNEEWAQSYVGFAINDAIRLKPESRELHVTFETRVDWICEFLDESYSPFFEAGQRFDLTVWDRHQNLIGLVEIKDEPVMGENGRGRDIRRLAYAMKSWRALKFGMFIFSVRVRDFHDEEDRAEGLERKANSIIQTAEKIAGTEHGLKVRHHLDHACRAEGGKMLWAGVLLERALRET